MDNYTALKFVDTISVEYIQHLEHIIYHQECPQKKDWCTTAMHNPLSEKQQKTK